MIGPTQTSAAAPCNRSRHFHGEKLAEAFAVSAEPAQGDELLAADFEAGDALQHVGSPARLAEFAVIDHVDARLSLASHHIGHGVSELRLVSGLVEGLSLLLRFDEIEQLRRTNQAADVGGKDAVFATLHRGPLMR